MILCITPDHDVYRYADDTPTAQLQALYDADNVILRIKALGRLDGSALVQVEDWIGASGDAPAIGWTRVDTCDPSIE